MSLHAIITTHLAHLHDNPDWDFETARDELVEAVEREVRDSASSQVRACFWACERDLGMRECEHNKTAPAGALTPVLRGLTPHHSTTPRSAG